MTQVMIPSASPLREMFESLNRRRRPEEIADLVLNELRPALAPAEAAILREAAHLSAPPGGTSMSQDFARPVGAAQQVRTAAELFPGVDIPDEQSCDDPHALNLYIARIETFIGKTPGRSDFKKDRLDRKRRAESGLEWSKRQYNKRFRLAARMEAKCQRLEREWEKRSFTLLSKSRLASRLTWEEFSSDRNSSCFVAYYTARCNLRSEFTISGQQRPYDTIADALFNRCRQSPSTNWWAIAHVFPDQHVLGRLDDAQRGELLGRWFSVLERLAVFLRDLWQTNRFNRQTMIVRKGNDSTTWNATAGAWNRARDSWFALMEAMGMEAVISALCPGKTLRLMAADVAAWHRRSGGGLDADTFVWNELPLPWEVISGHAQCTRAQVEAICQRHGLDPAKSSWIAARTGPMPQPFSPTPELVHGVTVAHPGLATILRKMGVFSGKGIKPRNEN
jgi:hypothetical protein